MKVLMFVLVATVTQMATQMALADETALRVPITRGGQTTTRLAYKFWSGEYPGPIVDVGGSNKGSTTVPAYRSLRKLEKPVSCTIKNGLYHVWSDEKTSAVDFYTLSTIKSYRATVDTDVETMQDEKAPNLHMAAGSQVTNVVYFSEGNCGGRFESAAGSAPVALDIIFSCDLVMDNKNLKQVSPAKSDEFNEQWIRVACADGSKAFVQDKTLLKQKGVTEGEIVEYGKVGHTKK